MKAQKKKPSSAKKKAKKPKTTLSQAIEQLKSTSEIVLDWPTSVEVIQEVDGVRTEYSFDPDGLYSAKRVPDDVRFVDPCPGCVSPETFEFFNKGNLCVSRIEDRECFQIEDTGSGFKYRSNPTMGHSHIDYSTANDLVRSLLVMNVIRQDQTFGTNWYVDSKGQVVENFNKLLQNIKDYCNTK